MSCGNFVPEFGAELKCNKSKYYTIPFRHITDDEPRFKFQNNDTCFNNLSNYYYVHHPREYYKKNKNENENENNNKNKKLNQNSHISESFDIHKDATTYGGSSLSYSFLSCCCCLMLLIVFLFFVHEQTKTVAPYAKDVLQAVGKNPALGLAAL